MESPVDIDGDHHEKVGEHDEDAHGDSQAHHQPADSVPFSGKVLPTAVVEKGDGLIVVALVLIHGGSGAFWKEEIWQMLKFRGIYMHIITLFIVQGDVLQKAELLELANIPSLLNISCT